MFTDIVIGVLWALHLISCVLLVIVVLLQSGRGSGMAGLFGGGAGDSPFGAKTGTFLGKVTGGIATFFILSSVILAVLFSGGSELEDPATDEVYNPSAREADENSGDGDAEKPDVETTDDTKPDEPDLTDDGAPTDEPEAPDEPAENTGDGQDNDE